MTATFLSFAVTGRCFQVRKKTETLYETHKLRGETITAKIHRLYLQVKYQKVIATGTSMRYLRA